MIEESDSHGSNIENTRLEPLTSAGGETSQSHSHSLCDRPGTKSTQLTHRLRRLPADKLTQSTHRLGRLEKLHQDCQKNKHKPRLERREGGRKGERERD